MSRRFLTALFGAIALACLATPGGAGADPVLRAQLTVNGDFALFGNTLAHDCFHVATPIVGTVPPSNQCGAKWNDTGVDLFWRSDRAGASATAGVAVAADQAQSTAVLSMPAGAVVRYARIYWAAQVAVNAYDSVAQLTTPDGAVTTVTADQGMVIPVMDADRRVPRTNEFWYQASAEITDVLQRLAEPRGPYTVAGVSSVDLVDYESHTAFAAWWAVVFYEDANDPSLRLLTLFDGLDYVEPGAGANVMLGGFHVPEGGFDAKLGVVAYEGDDRYNGDGLAFQGYRSAGPDPAELTTVSDALNPADDFFNGTRAWLGASSTLVGDLPQMTGAPASMMSFDMDVVDLKALGAIGPGDDAARIRATSTGDVYALGAFVTSINTLRPSFMRTEKTATNLTRSEGTFAGDLIEYCVSTANTGNDPSVGTVLLDPLPAGVTFVPGSLEILSGANAGPKSDAAGDDQAEYDAAARRIVVRLGAGADAAAGGSMAVGERADIRFRVQVDPGASGTVNNQVEVVAGGLSGEPPRTFGSSPPGGTGPTPLPVDACALDADCGGATSACFTAPTPNVCVGCTSDAHCGGTVPFCDVSAHVCVGLTTIAPAAQEETTVAGTAAPFPMALTSLLASPDVFDLDVASTCAWDVELRDGGGALLGTRSGEGPWTVARDTNADGRPDAGETPAYGTSALTLWLIPPVGTDLGSSCTVTVSAHGSASGLSASAAATLHTSAPATWTPSRVGSEAKVVSRGGQVGFPGVIRNNTGVPLAFDVSVAVTASPDAGALAPHAVYSDPDGDGDPADGAPIASTGAVAAYGGEVHVVVVLRALTATGAPLATGTTLHALATASAGAIVATQSSEARVQLAATYSDAAHTVVQGRFAPCDTVHLAAQLLPSGFPYALEWYPSADPVRGSDTPRRVVDPWPVSGGRASDALPLPADAGGTWTVLVVGKTTPDPTIVDAIAFEVERNGAFVALETSPRIGMADGLGVSAAVRNGNVSAALSATQLAYSVTDGASFMDGTGAFSPAPATAHLTSSVDVAAGATAADAWGGGGPAWPAPGVYRVDADWRVQCGGTSVVASATTSFEVVPAAPAITSPAGGALVATRTPIVSGTGLRDAAVTVSVGSASCGPATVDPAGAWSCTLDGPLGDGAHVATAVQVYGGAASDPSAPAGFTVDASAPAVAVAEPLGGALLGGSEAPARLVVFSGTAEELASVTITAGGKTAVAARAGASWSASLTFDTDGVYTATATATDAAGNAGTAEISFTLDTTPPQVPTIMFPVDGALLGAGDLAGAFLTVTGTGDPDAVVTVTVGGASVAATFTGASWSATFMPGEGSHSVTATAVDAAGNVSGAASASFGVDTVPPELPTFTSPADGATLSAADVPGGALTLAGHADADAAVSVTVDGTVHAATVAAGAWSLPLTLADGTHPASAVAVDAAGNAAGPVTIVFTTDANAPVVPELTAPSEGAVVAAGTVVFVGTAEPGATASVGVNGTTTTAVAADDGSFSIAVTLPVGEFAAVVTATDPAGNVSPPLSRAFEAAPVGVVIPPPPPEPPAEGSGGGCGCRTGGASPSALLLFPLALLLAPRRRLSRAAVRAGGVSGRTRPP